AMITLMPAPTPGGPATDRLAEQPVVMVQEPPVAVDESEAPEPTTTQGTASPRVVFDSSTTPPPAQPNAPTIAAGPATAGVTSSATAKQTALDLDGPTGGTEWNHRSESYCESTVAQVLCQAKELVPTTE
nr:hypothetical protein [Actinomycetota bacterium]